MNNRERREIRERDYGQGGLNVVSRFQVLHTKAIFLAEMVHCLFASFAFFAVVLNAVGMRGRMNNRERREIRERDSGQGGPHVVSRFQVLHTKAIFPTEMVHCLFASFAFFAVVLKAVGMRGRMNHRERHEIRERDYGQGGPNAISRF
ncbi:hypothetical protein FF011L_36660 [Roseimaritima multifibrata]|uniref:Uncharacterized protein n=1 Tax=Roseimaritima multifibrata TaxID=1930274 RepID=A0A517MJ57_9BACT|nr:hypothetical protein FF011L_36660 [Roseimaritima multifibrata]